MTYTKDFKPLLSSIVVQEIIELSKIQDICINNLRRIKGIVYVNRKLDPDRIISKEFSQEDLIAYVNEVHRIIIVFSHSTMETAVCDIVQYLLKLRYTYEPLKVLALLQQKKKFSEEEKASGDIDKLIQEYITSSAGLIDQFVNSRKFNKKSHIVDQLKAVGIDPKSTDKLLDLLNEMMLRRHNIAHKFDYIQENGQKRLNDIEFRAVVEWTNNLMDFLQGLLKDVFLSDQLAIDIQGKAKTLGVIATKEEVQETIKGFIHIDRFDIPWSKTK